MNELMYLNHVKKAEEAKSLYQSLREIYGDGMEKHDLFRRAYFDGLINMVEKGLLMNYI